MTILRDGGYRGYFDPVGLGFHAPAYLDAMKWNDEASTADWGAFIHEITHYLQFFGTVFGIRHLAGLTERAARLGTLMSRMAADFSLVMPVRLMKVDLEPYFESREERALFSISKMNWRQSQEELHGWTFPEFSSVPIIDCHGNPRISSPLNMMSNLGVVSVIGEQIIEGHAAYNECLFYALRSPSPEIGKRLEQRFYHGLQEAESVRYKAVVALMNMLGMDTEGMFPLRGVIFLILLNQRNYDYDEFLGEYTLARNMRTVVRKWPEIRKGLDQVREGRRELLVEEFVAVICEVTKLDNPYEALGHMGSVLREAYTGKSPWRSTHWISHRFINWQLKNRSEAVLWPLSPDRLLESVPIFKLTFKKSIEEQLRNGYLNLITEHPDDIHLLGIDQDADTGKNATENHRRQYRKYISEAIVEYERTSLQTYLFTSIFEKDRFKCPYCVWGVPKHWLSCKGCSGIFPDGGIGEGCAVAEQIFSLGLGPVSNKNTSLQED